MARFYISRRSLKRPGPRTVKRYIHYTYTYAVFIALIRYQMVSSLYIYQGRIEGASFTSNDVPEILSK